MTHKIQAHGGELVNLLVTGEARQLLLDKAAGLVKVPVNTWTISDIDLIAVGAFSPLNGFMQEDDYHSVVDTMRLVNGTVWSIPITFAVDDETLKTFSLNQQIALVGETDEVIYAVMDVQSIYQVDQQKEAVQVFRTNDEAHPGVQKLL